MEFAAEINTETNGVMVIRFQAADLEAAAAFVIDWADRNGFGVEDFAHGTVDEMTEWDFDLSHAIQA